MSQSVTVLSGVANSTIGGLVTVPLDIQASIASALQTVLISESNSVVGGTYYLNNINAITANEANYTVSANTSGVQGLLEFTNTNANGSVVAGTTSFHVTSNVEPDNYSTLIVQAPSGSGTDFIRGNSDTNQLVIFGQQSKVTYVSGNGGSGTVVAGASNQVASTNGNWTIFGSTDGGDNFNVNGSSELVNTYGKGSAGNNNGVQGTAGVTSNTVGIFGSGGSATVNAGGTDDLVNGIAAGANIIVSVNGSAAQNASGDVLVSSSNMTVYAGQYSSNVEAFFETGGTLYFVNQSSVNAYVTGDVPGATGGSATVFGGQGGGTFTGGSGGTNSLIGGFAPGQATTAGGAGLVTLTGSSSGNFLEATGSVTGGGFTQNVLTASFNGGNATLVATNTTSVNTFNAGNAALAVVSSSGVGLQTYNMVVGGSETVTGSTAAKENLFVVPATSVTANQNPSNDIITNFIVSTVPGAQDLISITGGASVAAVTSITGGAYAGNTLFTLSDGTTIKLTSVAYNSSYQSFVGKTTI